MNIRMFVLALCVTLGSIVWSGCAAPPEYRVKLELVRKSLEKPENFKLWVIKDKLLDGSNISCADLLKQGADFKPTTFGVEKEQAITQDSMNDDREEVTAKALTAGKKLFVAAGYKKGGKPTEPVAVGCTPGEIKGGDRLFVSVFLAFK